MTEQHASISIVCVYNNPAVREQCLDRSIDALSAEGAEVEYLPIENASKTYQSAGAALNHGVSLAKNDVVVFVHQDVYLHSLTALKEAAGRMAAEGFGLLGAIGVRSDSLLLGRIRDRMLLAGEPVEQLTEVDSVDEVLFMAPRRQLLKEPLTESPDLAWHAYAVEYGLRMRRAGLKTGVADIPLTHNSLSVNLARLEEAHRAVASTYSELLPVITTCGTITGQTAKASRPALFAGQRWRYRWLLDSRILRSAAKAAGQPATVLADLRNDVDDVIDRAPGRRLRIINCSHDLPFAGDAGEPLELARRDGTAVYSDCAVARVAATLKDQAAGSWTLVTNVSEPDLPALVAEVRGRPSVLGYHMGTGLWLLLGPTRAEWPPSWRSGRAAPFRAGLPPERERAGLAP
jgi:hypothetical protein